MSRPGSGAAVYLASQTSTDFACAKCKHPQLPVENPHQGLRFLIFLDVALPIMCPGSCTGLHLEKSLEEEEEMMIVLVERQTDQRQVISIRASHQDRVSECSLPLYLTPRETGHSFVCIKASQVRGSLCMGHTSNKQRQEPRQNMWLRPARCNWRFPGRSQPNTRPERLLGGGQVTRE